MKIGTQRFGMLEYEEEKVITFPEGILGFPDAKKFIILHDEIGHPFQWMQSVDSPETVFVVINPREVLPSYTPRFSVRELKPIRGIIYESMEAWVLVTMAPDIVEVTVNLLGPLLVNPLKRLGMQYVLTDSHYSSRHQLFAPNTEEVSDTVQQNRLAKRSIN